MLDQHVVADPRADFVDPVVEAYKADVDMTLITRNLRLTVAQRAEQLVRAARFLNQWRPRVAKTSTKEESGA